MAQFCSFCKSFKDAIARVEEGTGRAFCADCAATMPLPPEIRDTLFLLATIPFKPGDRVECRTGALLYDGIGTVREVSFDLEHGGTMVCPSFRVEIDDKAYEAAPDECYYTEVCLTKVDA